MNFENSRKTVWGILHLQASAIKKTTIVSNDKK